MRIVYIHQYFTSRQGASGIRSREQAIAMTAAGHHVTVLTSSANLGAADMPPGEGAVRQGRIDGVDCIVLDVPYDQRMGYARRIASFVGFLTLGID